MANFRVINIVLTKLFYEMLELPRGMRCRWQESLNPQGCQSIVVSCWNLVIRRLVRISRGQGRRWLRRTVAKCSWHWEWCSESVFQKLSVLQDFNLVPLILWDLCRLSPCAPVQLHCPALTTLINCRRVFADCRAPLLTHYQ